MRKTPYAIVKSQTKNVSLIWKEARGIVDSKVADKLEAAMLNWMSELTDCLEIWITKGENMTDGELILARANLGALVESWLKFYYCVFYIDFINDAEWQRHTMIEPNEMQFNKLQEFSVGKLWKDRTDDEYLWVDKIRKLRNSIHSFNYKDIGTGLEFIKDLDKYYQFVDHILNCLPPVFDFLPYIPEGYEMNVYYE